MAPAAAVCLMAACGCGSLPQSGSRTGAVGMDMRLPPPGAAAMELPPTQRFVFPRPIDPVAVPGYPAHLLAKRLDPVVACVEIDVGVEGLVDAARPLVDAGCSTGPTHEAFAQAALASVRRWRFVPATLCIAPDRQVDDPCLHPRVVEQPVAVRLAYAFRFSQQEGVARVQVEDAGR